MDALYSLQASQCESKLRISIRRTQVKSYVEPELQGSMEKVDFTDSVSIWKKLLLENRMELHESNHHPGNHVSSLLSTSERYRKLDYSGEAVKGRRVACLQTYPVD